ncbi:MAG: hypothetical protein JJU45_02925 [Acidimicrobiia bacterium]|nr:hypothetical protein [Acidimicrobiia bacterium]
MAAGAAVATSRRQAFDVLLVDLAGDQPAVLGVAEPDGPGVADWLATAGPLAPDALRRLEVPLTERLSLLPRGAGPLDGHRADLLTSLLLDDRRTVVVDAGVLPSPAWPQQSTGGAEGRVAVAEGMATSAAMSLLVTRACYLSLRRATSCAVRPSGVVVLSEGWRALGPDDVTDVLGVPVVGELPVVGEVARCVDAGLMLSRLPRILERAVCGVG